MRDAVPVGGEFALAQIVGFLGSRVARVPEVVEKEQAGRETQPTGPRRSGKNCRPGGLGEVRQHSWGSRTGLRKGRAERLVVAERGGGERGDQIGRIEHRCCENCIRRLVLLEPALDL
jgi:hypothetical protein